MTDWTQIGTIVALCLIIFNILPAFLTIQGFVISLLRRLPVPGNRCGRLLWEDIPVAVANPEVSLHICSIYPSCRHEVTHENHEKECWERLFSVVFSQAWVNNNRREKRIIKPMCLSFREKFLQIDFNVLMAFLVSTIGCHERGGSILLGLSTYAESDTFVIDAGGAERLEMQVRDKCLIAHLYADRCRPWGSLNEKSIKSFTKSEVEKFLDGYPPYYSSKFTLHNKKTEVDFPIHSRDDITKGGWVLAVKFGDINSAHHFYFESQPTEADSSRKPTFRLATEWVRDLLTEPFTRAFPNDPNVRAASKAISNLCSGIQSIHCALEDSELSEQAAYALDGEATIKAMDIFNRPTRMTVSERAKLKDDSNLILVPMFSAAVFGVMAVIELEKACVNLKEKLPPWLRPSSRIYVRDCVKTGFDVSRK